jgi:hypothetical protein
MVDCEQVGVKESFGPILLRYAKGENVSERVKAEVKLGDRRTSLIFLRPQRKTTRVAIEYMYIVSWLTGCASVPPVRTAIMPYAPATLLSTAKSEIMLTPARTTVQCWPAVV